VKQLPGFDSDFHAWNQFYETSRFSKGSLAAMADEFYFEATGLGSHEAERYRAEQRNSKVRQDAFHIRHRMAGLVNCDVRLRQIFDLPLLKTILAYYRGERGKHLLLTINTIRQTLTAMADECPHILRRLDIDIDEARDLKRWKTAFKSWLSSLKSEAGKLAESKQARESRKSVGESWTEDSSHQRIREAGGGSQTAGTSAAEGGTRRQ
jgi:hypothetical protein